MRVHEILFMHSKNKVAGFLRTEKINHLKPMCRFTPAVILRAVQQMALLWLCVFMVDSPAKAEIYKEFKDWSVSCDAELVCQFVGDPGEGNLYSIGFKRGTEANAPLTLQVEQKGKLNEESDVILSVPGQLEEISFPVSEGTLGEYGVWEFRSTKLRSILLPALKKGNKLRVQLETSEGFVDQMVPLSGVVASLLFLDETQGRVDHVDALQALGPKPAQNVETRVRLLKHSSELPQSVKALWSNKINECSDTGEDGNDPNNDIITRFGGFQVTLEKKDRLYFLPCGVPGAYNLPYVAFAYHGDEDAARWLAFPTMGAKGPTIMDTAFNLYWDDKRSELSAFFKGRGIGDCGLKSKWRLSPEDIYGELELIEERMKDDCDERHDNFPVTWPIK